MNDKLIKLALSSLLLASACLPVRAQTNELRAFTAVEIEYQTELGKTYILQGSVDLQSWTSLGASVLGNGQTVNQVFSTKDANVHYASYRISISPGPTNGYAPWTMAGAQLQMDDLSASNQVNFASATNGADVYVGGSDPFNYQYLRTAANSGRAERFYSPARRDLVTYSFTGAGVGTWDRDEFEQGVLKNHGIGSFHYLASSSIPNGTNSGVVLPALPTPPTSLTGLVYYVFTGPVPDKYQFNDTGNGGIATPGSTSNEGESAPGGNVFTYTYSITNSTSASLAINFGYYGIGGDRQEYDLTFTDGISGQFNRRIYRLGSLFTTDHGVFSPNAVLNAVTDSNNSPGGITSPPASPFGRTATFNFGTTPTRLVFQSAAAGLEFDDSAPSDFSYTYQTFTANTFTLRVQFKPDKWDEYDLTFTTPSGGTAVRRQFRNSALNQTDGGTFSLSPTN